jgi:hypothetical protein
MLLLHNIACLVEKQQIVIIRQKQSWNFDFKVDICTTTSGIKISSLTSQNNDTETRIYDFKSWDVDL